MPETRNIVVLGASMGGLSAAHYLARHTLPKLQSNKDVQYVLHLVDPSTHFWWHIAAPREAVSVEALPHDKAFVPIMDGFKQYTSLQDSIVFHHRAATALDPTARVVTLKPDAADDDSPGERLEYYALVIATGVRSPTACTTLQGDHTISQRALEELNAQLAVAKDVIIGGGGPVAVELAGEIGSHLQGRGAKVTLITGAPKLLPVLSAKLASKAEKQLAKLGVTVRYGVRVESTTRPLPTGPTEVRLANGETLTTDVYVPAVGVTPNTGFLPAALKQSSGYVATDKTTLRVEGAGARVYAAGDVAGVDAGGALNLYNSLPVLGANLSRDLLGTGAERQYHYKPAETQLVPIGPKMGVGAFNGWSMPGFMVSKVKGKDYLLSHMSPITEGTQWKKA